MTQVSNQAPTAKSVFDNFKNKPEDCATIADLSLIKLIEMRTIRKMLTENCMDIINLDTQLDPLGYATIIYPEDKYKEHRIKKYNKQLMKDIIREKKAAITGTG